jgi:hypothetical protein
MKGSVLKGIRLASFMVLLSFSWAAPVSGSGANNIMLSYDFVEKDTTDTGHTLTLTIRLKINNVGEGAIDKVTAYVTGTEGMAVSFDHIFFGLIEGGETRTSDSFELVVEKGNSQEVSRRGIVWDVEYETRYGTHVVEKVPTHFQQDPGGSLQ